MSAPEKQEESAVEHVSRIDGGENFILIAGDLITGSVQLDTSETPIWLTWRDISSAPPTGWIELYRPAAALGVHQRIVLARWSEEANGFVWPDRTYDPFGAPAEAEEAIDAGDCYVCDSFTHWRPVVFPEGEQR